LPVAPGSGLGSVSCRPGPVLVRLVAAVGAYRTWIAGWLLAAFGPDLWLGLVHDWSLSVAHILRRPNSSAPAPVTCSQAMHSFVATTRQTMNMGNVEGHPQMVRLIAD
jgi:hypothetical protein